MMLTGVLVLIEHDMFYVVMIVCVLPVNIMCVAGIISHRVSPSDQIATEFVCESTPFCILSNKGNSKYSKVYH